jgi:hypothetical protein
MIVTSYLPAGLVLGEHDLGGLSPISLDATDCSVVRVEE